MRAGQLRETITIQRKSPIKDGQGGERVEWVTYIVTKAAIWPLSASQVVQHSQLESEITHRVRTRYQRGITPDMRIVHEGRIFYIQGPPINNEERNRMLDILCREEVQ